VDSGEELYRAAGEPKECWFEPKVQQVGVCQLKAEVCEERIVVYFDRHLLGR
jgi:hypothetical protein